MASTVADAPESAWQGVALARRVFEDGPVGIAIVRLSDMTLENVNPRFAQMLGYSREEILRVPFPALTHPDDLKWEMAAAARLIQGETTDNTIEKRFLRKDGSVVHVKVTASIVHDEHGRPAFGLSFVDDITDRKLAEAQALQAGVSRPLVRRIVRELLERGRVDAASLDALGRDLARDAAATGMSGLLDTFSTMGLGSLRLVDLVGTRHTFEGEDLLERREGTRMTTCFMALGYLKGVVARLHERPTIGTEVACVSRGDAACRFVIQAR